MFTEIALVLSAVAVISAQENTPQSACSVLAACERNAIALDERCQQLRPKNLTAFGSPPLSGPIGPPSASPDQQARMKALGKSIQEQRIQCWIGAHGNNGSWCNAAQQSRCEKALSDYASGARPTPPPITPWALPTALPTAPPTAPVPAGVSEAEFREYEQCLKNASRESFHCALLRGCCPEVLPCEFEVLTSAEGIERSKLDAEVRRQDHNACLFMPGFPYPGSPPPSSPHPNTPQPTTPAGVTH